MFEYPIPLHSLAAWKTRVAINSHSPTTLAIATANAILRNLEDGTNIATPETATGQQIVGGDSILSLAADLQQVLGDAIDMVPTMFSLKATTACKGQVLPHQQWPISVLHDIHAIFYRTKALRRLATLVAATPDPERETLTDEASPHHKLWTRVTNPLILRSVTSPRSGTWRP